MKRMMLALAFVGSAAVPAFAEGAMMAAPDNMACSDYTAMDADGRMNAMQALDSGMSAADQMKSGEMLASTCADHPDMMVGDAMKMMKR